MFGLFKPNPVKKMKKEYQALLTKGMEAQRSGNIQEYARLTAEAEEVNKKIQEIEGEQ